MEFEKKKIGNKEVEVVKRIESGKVIEIAPGLTREEIPKPVSTLPQNTSRKLLCVSGGIVAGLVMGIVLTEYLRRKKARY